MYNSQTMSNELNHLFPSSLKEELQKSREAMASDFCNQQLNLSLMRYRSAPSSLLANFIDSSGDECDDFLPRSTSSKAESMFARFISCNGGNSASPDLHEIREKPSAAAASQRNDQFIAGIEHEEEVVLRPNGFSYHSSAAADVIERSYRNSMAIESQQVKSDRNCSNLIRHSSSPAGLFSHLTVENSYAVMRGKGNFRGGNGTNGEATASTSGLKSQMGLLSRQTSSRSMMSQISETGGESIGASSPDDGNLGNGRVYITGGFPISSWDGSSPENFTILKGVRDINGNMISSLNPSEDQNEDARNRTSGLSYQFSLPNTSSEMDSVEKFLQFHDSVPCKIRAKRGCATHPRSIAERVRRTRISERTRKLQELVPNMDKQTSTAAMLDLAVDYIKDLQKQVKMFSDNQARCNCSSKQKP